MTTRFAAGVFIAFFSAVVLLRAQEHPRALQQSQWQQLPQSAKISRSIWSNSTTIGSRILAAINISPVSDMKGVDGKIYDIDFLTVVKPGKLTVTETSVHKVNGKPLYNWKQENGVWKKVKV